MAYTTINKPTDYFNTVLYTGNGTARTITTGLETTDFVWNKRRDNTGSHLLYDKVRGVNKDLNSESTEAEETQVGTVTAFGTDNFSLGTHGATNASGESKVNWCWSAGGTTGSSNTDGSITSTVSANTTSGFSVVSYTGNGSTATFGHGLGATVDMVIVKDRTRAGENWVVYHKSLGKDKVIYMNLTNAPDTATDFWGTSTPNSSVFGVKSGNTSNNWSGDNFIAYCFAEKTGYSKFGSYTSNNNADGPFIYCGFKPAFLIIKNITIANTSWELYDNKRTPNNVANLFLRPNTNEADISSNRLDILSNGFKLRQVGDTNANSDVMIYMAFAEAPLVGSNNVPCTAR